MLLKRTAACSLLLAGVLAAEAGAQGCIILPPPRPRPIPPPPPPRNYLLQVRSEKVHVVVKNHVAATTLDQVFHNDSGRSVEGTYVFPLPEGAAVWNFSLRAGGKRLEGEVLERDKARRIYEDIVRRLRDPALLEYVGRNAFRAKLFPLPPRGDQQVQLRYSQSLAGDNDTFRYTLPLRMTSGRAQPYEELRVTVSLSSPLPLKGIYSPTHKIQVHRLGERRATVTFGGKQMSPDKDFVLYYTVSRTDVGVNLVTHREPGEDGYFLLLLAPKSEVQTQEVSGKAIVFVCDTSGSMAGDDKLEQVQSALRFCLTNLNQDDRFALVTFSTGTRKFRSTLVGVTPKNVKSALAYVKKLKARGGTDIDTALVTALKLLKNTRGPRLVVFLTDGLPTVGETDPAAILRDVRKANGRGRARLYTFGVGFDVNTHLLDKLAQENHGVSQYVTPKEELEVVLSSFYEKIAYPVLTDVEVDFGAARTYDVYPKPLPDLFKGSQLTVFGRYRKPVRTRLTLTGRIRGKQQRFPVTATFARNKRNGQLPRLWATRKIGYLLDALRLNGDNRELRREIVDLSLEYGIVTPYTSFLIQHDKPRVAVRPQFRQEPPFVPMMEAPSGVRLNATGMPTKASGRGAVLAAQGLGKLKRSQVASEYESISPASRVVGKRRFYLTDGVWIDGRYREGMKTLKVKYLSDAYFQLLHVEGNLGPCLALGRKVRVCVKDVCVDVGPTGKERLTPADLKLIQSRTAG